MGCPQITTDRLVMRPFQDNDLEAFHQVMNASEVRRSLRISNPRRRDDVWREMAMWMGQWELRNSGNWAFDPQHWGNGFATESGQAAIDWAWENHDVDELVSTILLDNPASQAVAQRLGFTLREEIILPHFPSEPHGIWTLPRPS